MHDLEGGRAGPAAEVRNDLRLLGDRMMPEATSDLLCAGRAMTNADRERLLRDTPASSDITADWVHHPW